MMIAALMTRAYEYFRLFMLKLVVMMTMISAPMIVPTTVALPPVSGVPPTTVAAIASSSIPSPTREASLAPRRAV